MITIFKITHTSITPETFPATLPSPPSHSAQAVINIITVFIILSTMCSDLLPDSSPDI